MFEAELGTWAEGEVTELRHTCTGALALFSAVNNFITTFKADLLLGCYQRPGDTPYSRAPLPTKNRCVGFHQLAFLLFMYFSITNLTSSITQGDTERQPHWRQTKIFFSSYSNIDHQRKHGPAGELCTNYSVNQRRLCSMTVTAQRC